jgi:hypothetical protein
MIVQVYRNLTRKCYSLRSKGLVIDHATDVTLKNAVFKINQRGVQKIREGHRKYVVAVVEGVRCEDTYDMEEMTQIRFNPKQMDTFQTLDGKPVYTANLIALTSKGVYMK